MRPINPIELNSKKKWTLATFLYLGLGAVVLQLRGALLLNFQNTFGVSESLLGLVAPAGTLGFTAIALTTGMIAGRIRIRRLIQIGALLTAITTFLIGLSPAYYLFLTAILLRGMASGIPGGLTRPMLGHLYPENRGRIFNIHEAVWAVGAACGPLFATLILQFGSWRLAYYSIGIAFLPVFFLLGKTSTFHADIREQPLTRSQLLLIVKDPVIIAVGVMLFLNVGVEGGFFTWIPYYLSQSLPQSVANFALTGFIGAYVPGRLLNSYLTNKFPTTTLILIATITISLLIAVAFFFTGGYGQIAVIVSIGFFISTIFPNLFSLAANVYPEHSGPINGLMMTFDPLGFSILPAVMGIIANTYGIGLSMRLLIVPVIMVIITLLFLRRTLNRG